MSAAEESSRPVQAVIRPSAGLRRLYVVALALVAGLLLVDQALVEPRLFRLAIDAPTINLAGRQRMLSQRLAKAALALERASDPVRQRTDLAELEKVGREWTSAHESLRAGLKDAGAGQADLREAFAALEPLYDRMSASGRQLAEAQAKQDGEPQARARETHEALGAILETEGAYLAQMERVVGLYEREARAHVGRLVWTGRALTGLALLALGGIWLLILRPASRLIERQVAELERSQQELEARVRERTRALEHANLRIEQQAEERVQAEAQRRAALELASHASRTSTLGEMASGLAHELNQPLGAIANYAEGCLVELERDQPNVAEVHGALEKLRAATLRAGEVIKRIRRFVTRRPPDSIPFDPNQAVVEVAELMGEEARRRQVELITELAPDLPCPSGDVVQVEQVLINLVRNALEALSASEAACRTVVMRTRRAEKGAVEMSVSDTGEGIPGDRLDLIFDAYFSTRVEGMGMGLAISRTIVEAHQGTLTVESKPGVETIFRCTLPCADGEHDAGSSGICC